MFQYYRAKLWYHWQSSLIMLRLKIFAGFCKNKWILVVFKVTEVCPAQSVSLLGQHCGLCLALQWRDASVQGTKILGEVSYTSVAQLSLAPELQRLCALMLPSGEVALINSQYAIKLLCKIPLNWGRHSCYLEATFPAEFGVVTQWKLSL